jgi:hypothetical protein
MAKYRAVVGFSCPDGETELKNCLAGKPYLSMDVVKGDILDEPCPGLLKSWLANNCVEEVTGA